MPWADDGGEVPNAARCSPIAPDPAGEGESCRVEGRRFSGVDDCKDGAFCAELDPTGEGVCRMLCPEAAACANLEAQCVAWFDGGLPLCSISCDPFQEDCAGDGACHAVGPCDAAACGPEIGNGSQGDACDGLNDCGAGFQCVEGDAVAGCDAARCCTTFCDLGEAGSCADVPGTTCVQAIGDRGTCPPAPYSVGVCELPS